MAGNFERMAAAPGGWRYTAASHRRRSPGGAKPGRRLQRHPPLGKLESRHRGPHRDYATAVSPRATRATVPSPFVGGAVEGAAAGKVSDEAIAPFAG